MAGDATDNNTEDAAPTNSTLLFVNIMGPTDGHHREAAVQTKIRQHVVRAITKAHRKPSRNRRKLNTADILHAAGSSDKEGNAIVFDARSHKGHTEKRKHDETVAGTAALHNTAPRKAPAVIISATKNSESPPKVSKDPLSECQQHKAHIGFTIEQHPFSMLYQRLVSMSTLLAYSLAYTVMRNVNPDRK